MYFKKTAKGQAEIEGGVRELPQRLRMVLLLVDGKRSAVELRQMMANATPEALRSLLDEGYIAPTPAPAPKRRSSTASRTASPPQGADAARRQGVRRGDNERAKFAPFPAPRDNACKKRRQAH